MITQLLLPQYPLNHFIDHLYYYAGFNPAHAIDRFLPDGQIQLIIDFTETPKHIYHNETLKEIQSCSRAWFSGFRTKPITIPSGRESEMMIIQFKSGRVLPFVDSPLWVLKNMVVDAEQVLKIPILELREKVQHCLSASQKLEIVATEFLRFYQNQFIDNPFIDYSIQEIHQSPNQTVLKDLSQKVGYSQKHIIKMFKDHVGVTPKEYLKVIRFQKAIQEIEANHEINWTSLALDCGFYDQSHFISDFKDFSGYKPSTYVNLRGDQLNYIPLEL